MNKVPISNDSYLYNNFITEEERLELKEWVVDLYNRGKLPENVIGAEGRYWNLASNLKNDIIPLFYQIKKRIMECENLSDDNLDEHLNDFIGLQLSGAFVHPHKDLNRAGHTHTRYNLIVNRSDQGGQPIYDGNIIDYENCMLWRCEAGRYHHSSTPTEGKEYRMNISYGFQVPLNNQ